MATINSFINRLIQFGENNGVSNGTNTRIFLKKDKIKNIPATCCALSEVEVYDFDECKTVIDIAKSLNSPKSCDALKFHNDEIYLIEFKRWQQFINFQLTPGADYNALIQEQIKKFALAVKLNDSLLILNNLVYDSNFNITKQEKELYMKVPKTMILLIDVNTQISPIQQIMVDLSLLSFTKSNPEVLIKKYLDDELRQLPNVNLLNLQKPILLDCTGIDNFF